MENVAQALAGCFAVEHSPIWADGSTEAYASELERVMGGAARLAQLTGSRAHLRQGAPQILKVLSYVGVSIEQGNWGLGGGYITRAEFALLNHILQL